MSADQRVLLALKTNRARVLIAAAAAESSHPNLLAHDLMGLATQDELDAHAAGPHGGGGEHPDLTTHDALGLATDAALTAHADNADAHPPHAHPFEASGAVATHEAAGNPHPGYLTPAEGDAAYAPTHGHPYEAAGAVATHEGGAPHSGLATDAEVAAAVADHAATPHGGSHPDMATHDGLGLATDDELTAGLAAKADTSHGHVDGDIPAGIARDSEVTAAVSAHEASGNPHPTYETSAEAQAKVDAHAAGAAHTGLATDAEVATAVTDHAAAADPHDGYLLESAHTEASHTAMGELATQAELDTHAAGPHGGSHPDLATHDGLGLATDAEVTAAIGAHEAAGNPHAGYATDGDLTTHAGAADPHAGYQRESEKAAASGYASLDGSTKVPLAQLPTGTSASTVALGDAAAALDAAHAAAADPHSGYQKESEKGVANGYASLGAGGLVPIAQVGSGTPNGAKFVRDDGVLATPGGGDDARLVLKRLASQFDSSAVAPAKVTGLDQTLGIGTWIVEYFVRWRSSLAATGVKFDLNHSGTVTSFPWWQRQFDVSATAATAVPDQDAIQAASHVHMGFASRAKGTAGRGLLLSADTVNADMFTIIEALVEVSVSGDIQLYFGSEATGSVQSVMVGSVLRATKVA